MPLALCQGMRRTLCVDFRVHSGAHAVIRSGRSCYARRPRGFANLNVFPSNSEP